MNVISDAFDFHHAKQCTTSRNKTSTWSTWREHLAAPFVSGREMLPTGRWVWTAVAPRRWGGAMRSQWCSSSPSSPTLHSTQAPWTLAMWATRRPLPNLVVSTAAGSPPRLWALSKAALAHGTGNLIQLILPNMHHNMASTPFTRAVDFAIMICSYTFSSTFLYHYL